MVAPQIPASEPARQFDCGDEQPRTAHDEPAPDPGNTNPEELTEDLDEDDDVYDRISGADLGPAEETTDSGDGADQR